jgi:hypothetical protein
VNFPKAAILGLALSAAASGVIAAAGLGDEVPALAFKDAAGNSHTLGDNVRRIYANADRKGDSLMKDAMSQIDQKILDAQGAVVIADISEAPFFVKSIIRSSLKERRYVTWLDVTGNTQPVLPYRADHVTVLDLQQHRITAIRQVNTVEGLKRELTSAPAPAATPLVSPQNTGRSPSP